MYLIKKGNDNIRLMSAFPLHDWSKVSFEHSINGKIIPFKELCITTLDSQEWKFKSQSLSMTLLDEQLHSAENGDNALPSH